MSSSQKLTRWVDYRRRAIQNVNLTGQLTLADVPRTKQIVYADTGEPITVLLYLDEDAQRRVMLTGSVQTTLQLECQRCLQSSDQPMVLSIAGIVVASDADAADVPREWEPMLADGDQLDLHALIDDELLLGLPMTVHCDRPDCRAAYESRPEEPAAQQDPIEEKPNPFAVLAALKRDDNQSQ